MSVAIGFIGFGEAGSAIAKGLRQAGAGSVFAYDAAISTPAQAERLRTRATDAGIPLFASLAELAEKCEILISAVVANVAVEVAKKTAPHIKPRHLYVDINSVSPVVKQEIDGIIAAAGGVFVEAAVMDAVPPNGHRVPMLLCGKAAERFAEAMRPFGMTLDVMGEAVGPASATKMFRSILIKGLESLILESLIGANRYGVEARVLASVGKSFPGLDWAAVAHYLMGRNAIHGERRAHEMDEVAETLRALGIEPIMAEASARRIASTLPYKLKERFGGKAPERYDDVLAAIREADAQ